MSDTVEVRQTWKCKIPSGSNWKSQWSSPVEEFLKDQNVKCYLYLSAWLNEEKYTYSQISQDLKFQLKFNDKICERYIFKVYYTILVQENDNTVLGLFSDYQNISRSSLNGNEHLVTLYRDRSENTSKYIRFTILVKINLEAQTKTIQNSTNFSEKNAVILFNQISTDLSTLLKNDKYSDVVLKTNDDREIPAHKCLLAARSPVFAAMFTHDMKENQEKLISIDDADFDSLEAVLQFMYTGKFEPSVHGKFEVLVIADKYDIKSLRDLCETEISINIGLKNATTALVTADKHNLKSLREKTCKFLAAFMRNNLNSENLKKFQTEQPSLFEEILNLAMSDVTLE